MTSKQAGNKEMDEQHVYKPVIAGLNVRSVLIDVSKEAQHAGEVPP